MSVLPCPSMLSKLDRNTSVSDVVLFFLENSFKILTFELTAFKHIGPLFRSFTFFVMSFMISNQIILENGPRPI